MQTIDVSIIVQNVSLSFDLHKNFGGRDKPNCSTRLHDPAVEAFEELALAAAVGRAGLGLEEKGDALRLLVALARALVRRPQHHHRLQVYENEHN